LVFALIAWVMTLLVR